MMLLNPHAQTELLKGVNELADMVASTMGPGGSTVFINRMGHPHLTKDGVTVAKHCEASSPIAELGMSFLQGAAQASVDKAGDGTTTTTILARDMIVTSLNYTQNKSVNKHQIARHMINYAKEAVSMVKAMSRPVTLEDDLMKSIAMISTNGDEEMSETVIKVLQQVGPKPEAVSLILDDNIEKDVINFHKGFQIKGRIDAGIIQSYRRRQLAPTRETGVCAIYTCDLVDQEIALTSEVYRLIEQDVQKGNAILIIGKEFTKDFKSGITNLSKRHPVGYVTPNLHGAKFVGFLNDIHDLGEGVDVDQINNESGIQTGTWVRAEAGSTTVFKDRMIINNFVKENTEVHEKIIEGVKELIESSTNAHDRAMLKERLAILTSGMAEIRITGLDEQDRIEREDRFDDCIRACCTAVADGVVVGGGVNFARISRKFNEEIIGPDDAAKRIARDVMVSALIAPINVISKNAVGFERPIPYDKLTIDNLTVNAITGAVVDGFEEGILDPTGVQTAAINAATRAAGIFLTTGGVIYGKAETI